MATRLETDLVEWAAPVLAELDLTIYDAEVSSGRVRVTVDRPGGVGLDDIARCTRGLSPILDEHDPIGGKYTLEVSSPGLERKLRTVEHRRGAIGETVKCKYRTGDGDVCRIDGRLTSATEDECVIEAADGPVHVAHEDILTLHTVFVWPPARSADHDARRRNQSPRKATS